MQEDGFAHYDVRSHIFCAPLVRFPNLGARLR